MEQSDMPWKLKQSKTLNGYTLRIESADGLTIGEFYGSTNPMWDSVPGARQAQENARIVIDASCRIAELEKQLAEANAEIDRLSRLNSSYSNLTKAQEGQLTALRNRLYELKGADKTLDSERDANAILTEQLAAIQAREQQLREYLHRLACLGNGAHYGTSDGNRIAQVALALHTDTTALEAMIAKAGEVMRERCFASAQAEMDEQYIDSPPWYVAEACRDAISTLPGVTLEDLKA